MSLCRWSDSPWYIYDIGKNELGEEMLQVSFHGAYTASEILQDWKNIYNYTRNEGYSVSDSLELLVWIYPWALGQSDKVKWKIYIKVLKFTRFLSYTRRYCQDHDKNMLRYSSEYVYDIIEKLGERLSGDEVHKLTPEEKSAILDEYVKAQRSKRAKRT